MEVLKNLFDQVNNYFNHLYEREGIPKEHINIRICSLKNHQAGELIVTGCHLLIKLLINKHFHEREIVKFLNDYLQTLSDITPLLKRITIKLQCSIINIQVNKDHLIAPLIKEVITAGESPHYNEEYNILLVPYWPDFSIVTMETGRLLMVTNILCRLFNVPFDVPSELKESAPLFSSILSPCNNEKGGGEKGKRDCDHFISKLQSLKTNNSINVESLLTSQLLYGRKRFPSNIKTINIVENGSLNCVGRIAADIDHTLSHDTKLKLLLLTTQKCVYQTQQVMALLLAAERDCRKLSFLEVGPISCSTVCNLEDYVHSRYDYTRQASESKYGPIQKGTELERVALTMSEAAIKFELLSTDPKNTLKIVLPVDCSSMDTYFEGTFVLYNYARVATIERNFTSLVEKGTYPPLPDLDKIDYTLLSDEDEWELLYNYVLVYPLIVKESMDLYGSEEGEMKVTSGMKKLCQFLIKLCHSFSQYYSRVKILLAPEVKLFSLIHARFALILSIKQVLKNGLQILGIKPLEKL